MSKNILTFASIGIALLGGVYYFSGDEFKDRLGTIFTVSKESSIAKLESKVDQGELALATFDKMYRQAAQKLAMLKALKQNAIDSKASSEARAVSYIAQGKPELAAQHQKQAAFYDDQSVKYNANIEKRVQAFKIFIITRATTKADIRFTREKIAHFKAIADALDWDAFEDMTNDINDAADNLNKECNMLNANIEVMLLSD